MAYLHTAPRPKARRGMTDAEPVTRLRAMLDAGLPVEMPPLGQAARQIVEHLLECGPVLHGAMGAVPLTYGEIAAYQQAAGVDMTPWEARMLRRASMTYVSASREAESPDAAPPWVDNTDARRERIARGIRSVFGNMAAKKG